MGSEDYGGEGRADEKAEKEEKEKKVKSEKEAGEGVGALKEGTLKGGTLKGGTLKEGTLKEGTLKEGKETSEEWKEEGKGRMKEGKGALQEGKGISGEREGKGTSDERNEEGRDDAEREKITDELPTHEYHTKAGIKIVRLSVNTLPRIYNNIYVVFSDDRVFLIDMGLMMDFQSFIDKFQREIAEKYSVGIEDIDAIFVTHAHIDHFGGLSEFRRINPNVKIYMHELDAKGVERFSESLLYARYYLKIFFARAGLDEEGIRNYISIYSGSKEFIKSVKVTRALEDGERLYGFYVLHTPAHSPGHICLILDNVIFTGDHILPYITPHQFPESIMRYTGIGHYIDSLHKTKEAIRKFNVDFGLPAHYSIIENVPVRIDEIIQHHRLRLSKLLDICSEPVTIVEATYKLFPDKRGYQFILALDEVGAHMEYLWDRGYISIYNLEDFMKNELEPIKWIKSKEMKY